MAVSPCCPTLNFRSPSCQVPVLLKPVPNQTLSFVQLLRQTLVLSRTYHQTPNPVQPRVGHQIHIISRNPSLLSDVLIWQENSRWFCLAFPRGDDRFPKTVFRFAPPDAVEHWPRISEHRCGCSQLWVVLNLDQGHSELPRSALRHDHHHRYSK